VNNHHNNTNNNPDIRNNTISNKQNKNENRADILNAVAGSLNI